MNSGVFILAKTAFFNDFTITSSLRSVVQVLMGHFASFQSHGLSGWFMPKITKSCLNLSKLRPIYCRSLFSRTRCIIYTSGEVDVWWRVRYRRSVYLVNRHCRKVCRRIIKSQPFYWLVIIMVFLNTCMLTSEHHLQPLWLDKLQGSYSMSSMSRLLQLHSCPWVHCPWPNPTQPVANRKSKNMDPTQPNPTRYN